MKKIFQYAYAVLFGVMAVGLASCTDSYSYDPATVSGQQVYFSNQLASIQELSKSASSFTIDINRQETSDAITVPLTVTGSGILNIPTSVSFNAGENTAKINVTYNPDAVEYGTYENYTITIGDESYTTIYGLTSYSFSAGATAWVKMAGKATYREDLVTSAWGVENLVYEVNIEKNIVEEGMYRLVNPYGAVYPYNEDGDWDDTQDYYLVIDATDPNYVHIPESALGADWGYGMWSAIGYADYFVANGNDLETVKSARPDLFGKFEDGVITMPAQSVLFNYGGGLLYGNGSGLFAVALPGYMWGDYSASLNYAGIFTNTAGEIFAVGELELGADAEDVKAVVVSEDADASAVADAIVAGDIETTDVQGGTIYVPIEEDLTGKLQIVVVVLKDGELKTVTSAGFEYYGGEKNPWNSLGIGLFTDNFFITMYSPDGVSVYDPYEFEVEIQESTETPGLYRLVNPFQVYGFDGYVPSNLEINATDPEGVYFTAQQTGIDDGDGMTYLISYGAYMLNRYDFDTLKEYGYFGELKDGVITLPKFEGQSSDGSAFTYQGLFMQGSSGWYTGTTGEFKVVLPEAVSAQARAKASANSKALSFAHRMNLRPFVPAKTNVSKKMMVKNSKTVKAEL